jgi:alpha-glucosidase
MRVCFVLLFAMLAGNVFGEPMAVKSPDGTLKLEFNVDEQGFVRYSFQADGRELIKLSPVGFAGGTLAGTSTRFIDTVWKPVWGKRRVVPERFNEITLDMKTYRLYERQSGAEK